MPHRVAARVPALLLMIGGRLAPRRVRERGDVPGWVLITMMTAALVALLYAFAGPQLQAVFSQAMDRVRGMG